jgi:hypothetical protein
MCPSSLSPTRIRPDSIRPDSIRRAEWARTPFVRTQLLRTPIAPSIFSMIGWAVMACLTWNGGNGVMPKWSVLRP